MTEQSSQISFPSTGWTFLARGEHENDTIARCPAGHIHVDYGNLTVRFHKDEFLAFAKMVTQAAARLQGVSPITADRQILIKRSADFSKN